MSQVNQQTTAPITPAFSAAPAVDFVIKIIEGYAPRDFAVRFWDGTILPPDARAVPRFTLALQHPGALRQMFWPFNKAALGEAYIYNDFDIEGDMLAFFRLLGFLQKRRFSPWQRLKLFRQLLRMPRLKGERTGRQAVRLSGSKHSLERDRQAIAYHYDDPPSEFFGLFLDPRRQYSCGYFSDPAENLDLAQERKVDYICRKLRLQPGERLIDIGCGWGGLIMYAAKNYGVQAVGVSLSRRQVDWARQRIQEQGLQDRCRVEYLNYRQFPETEPFDKAVSVGFFEHVGPKDQPPYFRKVWNLLRPQGVYLHHAITFRPFASYPPWRLFALKYVFPDGHLATITDTLQHMAAAGFEIRDVESLREHYALTLQNWLSRLEDRHEQARDLTDEVTYRIFRIYFAGSIQGFRSGLYNLNQTLVVKSPEGISGLPLTRTAWYT